MKDLPLIHVGWHKSEIDFGVNCSVADLSYEQMKEVRSMLCTAIYIMEDMWRRNQKHPTCDSTKS